MSLRELKFYYIQRIINCIYPHTCFWNAVPVSKQTKSKQTLSQGSLLPQLDPAASGAEANQRSLQRCYISALPTFLLSIKSFTFLQESPNADFSNSEDLFECFWFCFFVCVVFLFFFSKKKRKKKKNWCHVVLMWCCLPQF